MTDERSERGLILLASPKLGGEIWRPSKVTAQARDVSATPKAIAFGFGIAIFRRPDLTFPASLNYFRLL